MKKNTILVACGGHGRVVLDTALLSNIEVTGIIDNLPVGSEIFGIQVLGDDNFLESLSPAEYQILNGFGFTKSTELRKQKYLEWQKKGFATIGVKHPSVQIGREPNIDATVQLMAGVVLQNRVSIDQNTIINTRCSIDHDVSIGSHCFISPGVVICGGAKIGDEVFIGPGTIVLPAIEIGSGSVVTAGSVLRKNIPINTRYLEKKVTDFA